MQPEAVSPRFEAASKFGDLTGPIRGSRTQVVDQGQQSRGVASVDAVQPALGDAGQASGDKPQRGAQLDGDVDGAIVRRHGGGAPDLIADASQSERSAWAVSALIASATRARSAFPPPPRRRLPRPH